MSHHRARYLCSPVLIALAALLASPAWAQGKKPYRQVLISTDYNMNVDTFMTARQAIASRYAVPECPTPWTVRKFRYFGGKQEQSYVIWIDNGKLQISVVATRGLGVLSVLMDGVQVLGWNSPVKDVVHPSLIDLKSRGGLGWLEGFNEWLCRCGMEWNGQPGTDRFINNRGEEDTMELTLHGRVANLPAQEVWLIAEHDPPYRITIRGTVHERMFNGPNLELTSELSIEPGAHNFRISDAVTNRGGRRQEFQMLYHTSFGTPILDEGARFVAPVEEVTPFNARAAQDLKTYDLYSGPKPGFIEQTYAVKPLSDRSGRTVVMIQNKRADLGASMRYDTRELPYLTLWKNTAALEDGYVTAIEPGTNYPNNRRIERKHGRVPELSPGESYYMTLDFAVLTGKTEVAQVAQEISKLQGDRKPVLHEKPMPKE